MNKRMILIQILLLFQFMYIGLIMIQMRQLHVYSLFMVVFSYFHSLTCSSFRVFHTSSDHTQKYHNDLPIPKGQMQRQNHLVLTLYRHSDVP